MQRDSYSHIANALKGSSTSLPPPQLIRGNGSLITGYCKLISVLPARVSSILTSRQLSHCLFVSPLVGNTLTVANRLHPPQRLLAACHKAPYIGLPDHKPGVSTEPIGRAAVAHRRLLARTPLHVADFHTFAHLLVAILGPLHERESKGLLRVRQLLAVSDE